jgi:archaellum component FlaC
MARNISLSDERFQKIELHIEKYNEEMGCVQKDIAVINTKLDTIQESVKKAEGKTWWVITSVVASVVITMFLHIITE